MPDLPKKFPHFMTLKKYCTVNAFVFPIAIFLLPKVIHNFPSRPTRMENSAARSVGRRAAAETTWNVTSGVTSATSRSSVRSATSARSSSGT